MSRYASPRARLMLWLAAMVAAAGAAGVGSAFHASAPDVPASKGNVHRQELNSYAWDRPGETVEYQYSGGGN